MKWLNYNHLFYFWTVAREGGVIRASEELRVSQPTISNQLKVLEDSLGHKLFERAGRGLVLTDAGRITFNHTNAMFSIGNELSNALDHQPSEVFLRLAIGVVDVIPKAVASKLIAPAMRLKQPTRLICREDKSDRLLADLAARRIDLVLSDSPIGTAVQLDGYNHLLGESGISFLATKEIAVKARRGFPKSLNGMPMLLPTDHTQVRHSLNLWFDSKRIHPIVSSEFDDTAMMMLFGREGAGIFPVPSIIENVIKKDLGVQVVGRIKEVREKFYAITRERHPEHAAVAAICQAKAL